MADATALSTSDFGAALIANMPQGDHKTGNEPQAATKPEPKPEPKPEEAEKIDAPQSPEPTAA
jgi:hypothetical protein